VQSGKSEGEEVMGEGIDDRATLYVNLVNFDPVTLEFNTGKDVHPVVSFFKINLSDKLSPDPPDRLSPYGRYLTVDD